MSPLRYTHLDVFTERPLTGNQLAVFSDAEGLDSRLMQRIAREIAFPETTFVLPPTRGDALCRMRIFTPATELPMAGHPTIGTLFALHHDGRLGPEMTDATIELAVGPTAVTFEWNASRLRRAWMQQPSPEFGPAFDDATEIAAALGVEPAGVAGGELPAQVVSCGVPFLLVPLASRRVVDAATLDRTALVDVCRRLGRAELPVFIFAIESAVRGVSAYSRMFAPALGIAEDPATGGASGPLGAYLVRHGAVTTAEAKRLLNVQGVSLDRPSEIHISVDAEPGTIRSVRVGGAAVVVGTGSLDVTAG